jgi:hypothetical protein
MDYLELVADKNGVLHVRCCLTGRFFKVSQHGG